MKINQKISSLFVNLNKRPVSTEIVQQALYLDKRTHLLTIYELKKIYLKYINTLNYKVELKKSSKKYGRYIDDFRYRIKILNRKTSELIVDSNYMSDYEIYKRLEALTSKSR